MNKSQASHADPQDDYFGKQDENTDLNNLEHNNEFDVHDEIEAKIDPPHKLTAEDTLTMLIEERYTQANLYQHDQKYSDRVRIFVKGGKGGNGCYALKRQNHGHAMADGGDGGKGGDVYIRSTSFLTNLYQLRRSHFYGNPGKHGSGNRRNGKDGKDIRHSVPLGTEVYKI